ncbi:hypothetical protein D9757_005939 [Collybiopsis confluens]|uniref:Dihydroxyacetone kinase n=1 Tax=Collybiopsis confluens TaxID=2823264 RepID=A0A8H5MA58_9AGAR|nr:hypothetical protein D9757_005939 [Collybiopsis confluens]
MASKHLINSPSSLVNESLEGLCILNPELKLHRDARVLYRPVSSRQKVALICGGGAGHEPSHAGFVGKGLLTAAVSGNVFASPSGKQVKTAVELVHPARGESQGSGTLIIVKNYTGDVLNFGLAREALSSQGLNPVRFLTVGDDVAVPRSRITLVGRRGLAGTVLLYKIAGALAAQGGALDEVESIGKYVSDNLATIGVATGHSHVPGTDRGKDVLAEDEIEVGMGIHNEPGVLRLRGKNGSPPPLSEVIPKLVDMLTVSEQDDNERGWVPFPSGSDVVLMVNNLGGLSPLELSAASLEATKVIHSRGLNMKRVLSGSYMTSLNMPGFSLTLLKLPKDTQEPSQGLLLSLIDAPAEASGWGWVSGRSPVSLSSQLTTSQSATTSSTTQFPENQNQEQAQKTIDAIRRLAGAEGVLSLIDSKEITGLSLSAACVAIAGVAEDRMGGTSGGLYSIFFSALAQGLHQASFKWPQALLHALEKLYTYTRARPPSRTLVDPLDIFIVSLQAGGDVNGATKKAEEAAHATRGMVAKAGRAVYSGEGGEGEQGEMDPGAWGVAVLLRALVVGE